MFSCYYTSTNCKYFFERECYENYTSLYNASTCNTVLGGYFLNGRCYYNVPQNCSAGYYQQCSCYSHRSSTYSNITCSQIDGIYTDGYCYYMAFNCRGYAVNGQCYRRVTSISFYAAPNNFQHFRPPDVSRDPCLLLLCSLSCCFWALDL